MSARMHHASALRDVRPLKRTDGTDYVGNTMYQGNGRTRSCARCGKHSAEHLGGWRPFLGRSQWHGPCHPSKTESVAQATNGEARAATNSPGLISQLHHAEKQ